MRLDGDAPVYVISVAAKLSGMPAWMLRLLDQEGVVVPSRTEKNRRLYSDNDIARLERIRYLTEDRGVNMAGVKVILEIEEQTGRARHGTADADGPERSELLATRTPDDTGPVAVEQPLKETQDDLPRRR